MMADMGLIKKVVMHAPERPIPGGGATARPDEIELSLVGWTPEEITLHEKILHVVDRVMKGDAAYPSLVQRFNEIVGANDRVWNEVDHDDLSAVFGFIINLSTTGNGVDELRTLIRATAKELPAEKEQ